MPSSVLISDGVDEPDAKLTKTRDGELPTPSVTPPSFSVTELTSPSSEKSASMLCHREDAAAETGIVTLPEDIVTVCPLTLTVIPSTVAGDKSATVHSRRGVPSAIFGSVIMIEKMPVSVVSVPVTRASRL